MTCIVPFLQRDQSIPELDEVRKLDSNLIMAPIIKAFIHLTDSSYCVLPRQSIWMQLRKAIDECDPGCITPRELAHIDAIEHILKGRYHHAMNVWHDLLTDEPCDLITMKFAWDIAKLTYATQAQNTIMISTIS